MSAFLIISDHLAFGNDDIGRRINKFFKNVTQFNGHRKFARLLLATKRWYEINNSQLKGGESDD